jgi:hypothetical protein
MKNIITKQNIKDEIDKIKDDDLLTIYRIVQALVKTPSLPPLGKQNESNQKTSWIAFVDNMYGCVSDDPIKRGKQNEFEIRETLE